MKEEEQDAVETQYADEILHSVEWLIDKYHEQAYWAGQHLAIKAIQEGRTGTARALGKSLVRLAEQNYHMIPRKLPPELL